MNSISPQQEEQIREMINQTRMIDAIKLYREATGVGLKEAKDAVTAMWHGEPLKAPPIQSDLQNNALLEEQIKELLAKRQKIQAVKLYREAYNCGLKDAKDAVEAMERGETASFSKPAQVGEPDIFLKNQIKRLLSEKKKIEAIKIYREAYNCDLKEAKDAVDLIQVEMRRDGYTSMVSTPGISNDPFAEDSNRMRLIGIGILALLIFLGGLFFFIQGGF